jgi:hypothetical protein
LASFIATPNPRERIQRGHFQDAIRDLIEKQDVFGKGSESLRYAPDVEEQIKRWCIRVRELYEKLGRTAIIADKFERDSELKACQVEIESHWSDLAVGHMINRVSTPICKLEVAFLLSLCKHEEAERAQTEADYAKGEDVAIIKQKAKEAWINARAAWRNYYEGYNAGQDLLLGRGIQAKTLSARAEKFADAK